MATLKVDFVYDEKAKKPNPLLRIELTRKEKDYLDVLRRRLSFINGRAESLRKAGANADRDAHEMSALTWVIESFEMLEKGVDCGNL